MKVTIHIEQHIRDRLRAALVPEQDLLTIISRHDRTPVAGQPGAYHYRCPIPLPRPMDPETAEMHILDVYIRPGSAGGWEVYQVDGLPPVAE